MPRFYPGQRDYIEQLNAMDAAIGGGTGAVAAVTATSSTSLTVGTGSKSLTIETGRSYVIGQFILIVSSTNNNVWMVGQVTAHNSSTGALTVNVTDTLGSGTIASWTIALTGKVGAPGQDGLNGGLAARGAWVSSTVYFVNDIATYLGSAYRRKAGNNTATATNPAADTTNWEVFVSKGDTGATGTGGGSFPSLVSATISSYWGSVTLPARASDLAANRTGEFLRATHCINILEFVEGEYWNSSTIMADKVQEVLDRVHDLALILQEHSGTTRNQESKWIDVLFPMGFYVFGSMVHVPDYVNIICHGIIVPNRSVGGTNELSTDPYMPGLVFGNLASCEKLTYKPASSAMHGQGIVFGQCWNVKSVAFSGTGVTGGSGYTASQTALAGTLRSPDKNDELSAQYEWAECTVTTNASGVVTGVTLGANKGAYRRRPERMSNYASGAFPSWGSSTLDFHADNGTGGGTAKIRVTWMDKYEGSGGSNPHWNCGTPYLIAHGTIGNVSVINGYSGTENFSTTYGPMFGVCCHGMNVRIEQIMVQGQYHSIDFWKTVDTHADFLNTVGGFDAIRWKSGGAFTCPSIVVDSPAGRGLKIDDFKNLTIRGHLFSEDINDTTYGTISRSSAISIGQSSGNMCYHLFLEFMLENMGTTAGIPALAIDRCHSSIIDLLVCNRVQKNATGTSFDVAKKFFNRFAHIEFDTHDSVLLRGSFDNIGTPFSYTGDTQRPTPTCGIMVYDGTERKMCVNQSNTTITWLSGNGNN